MIRELDSSNFLPDYPAEPLMRTRAVVERCSEADQLVESVLEPSSGVSRVGISIRRAVEWARSMLVFELPPEQHVPRTSMTDLDAIPADTTPVRVNRAGRRCYKENQRRVASSRRSLRKGKAIE